MKQPEVKLCFSSVRNVAGRRAASWSRAAKRRLFFPALLICLGSPAWGGVSQDAYVRRAGDSWILGTAKVERTVTLQDGRLVTTSWKNKVSGKQLIPAGAPSDELRVGVEGQDISGSDGNWQLIGAQDHTLAQGEIQLDISLRHGSLEATKSFVVYPGSSIIREWVSFKNAGSTAVTIIDPGFLNFSARVGTADDVDFDWMTGGENRPGSWMLKTEKLQAGKPRAFDSSDPFGGTAEGNFSGDGVLARVMLNDRQVWPTGGWQGASGNYIGTLWAYAANATESVPLDASVDVARGEKLVFIVNKYGTTASDETTFDPVITYADGESHRASEEFGNQQGQNGWGYQYFDGGEPRAGVSNFAGYWRAHPQFVDLVYEFSNAKWRKPGDSGPDTMYISADRMHPGNGPGVARIWVAPRAGRVHISAVVSNTGNPSVAGAGRGLRAGSSSYAPWNALFNRQDGDGLFLSWDYFGRWSSTFTDGADGSTEVRFRVAGYRQILQPGESVMAPKAAVGLFEKDLDNAGNEFLDWQYRYLWDYTRDDWFPAIRISGWWWKGASWFDLLNFGIDSGGDQGSIYRKVFRVADLMSEVGADIYHRDYGWWDRMGDWDGPDWKSTGAYLHKHDMGQLIYAPFYVVDKNSKVAREHPDWVINDTLDLSKPEVTDYLKNQLDDFAQRFGKFELKNDGWFTTRRGDDDTPLLREDEAFRTLIRNFLDKHPESAFMSCVGGGNANGSDLTRYSSTGSFSDGPVGMIRNQWAALILPPDKTSENGDNWGLDQFDKATYRGLLTLNFDNAGDTWDPEKLEGFRQLVDIYHYLGSQGVVGRWVHVFRPVVSGDDPTMYFERLSRDGERGIIIPKRPAPGPVTIKPKGLNPAANYIVSFQESTARETRKGADLMGNGIVIGSMIPGELVYLNLPYHPGNHVDQTPPTPPSPLLLNETTNMGYPGVEVTWKAGHDDHWVSYYEVLRDGVVMDKVAKGTYYFDHSAGADLAARYEVRTVDEAGLRSVSATANPQNGRKARILDDAQPSGLSFTGAWQRQAGLQLAYQGTISRSDEKGASFEFEFEGTKFTWFTKLGDDGGKAEVVIDGRPGEVIDTYSADDIWGVGVYSKEFSGGGAHRVKIIVTGERGGPRGYGKGSFVYLDGISIQGEPR
jgi:hypothetical protein